MNLKTELLNNKNVKFVEIGLLSAISDEVISIIGEVIDVKEHGFDLECGGWGLYGNKTDKKAYFLIFRKKKHRNQVFIISRE